MKRTFKKLTAFALAISILAPMIYLPPVYAAGTSAEIIDNIDGKTSRTAMILNGETVKTKIVAPSNYHINEINPFIVDGIVDSEGKPDYPNYPIAATPEGNITAKLPAGKEMEIYSVYPLFNVFLTQSDVGILTAAVGTETGGTDNIRTSFEAKITNDREVSITQDSTLTLSLSEDQTVTGDIINMPIWNSADASGDLEAQYKGATVTTDKMDGDKLSVSLIKAGSITLKLELSIQSFSSFNGKMKAGTKFEITFAVQKTNAMQITILTPKKAAEIISSDINATANFADFVLLAGGDSSTAIKNKFKLKHKVQRYNSKDGFWVDWKWKPNNEAVSENSGVLKISGDSTNSEWLGTPIPLENDVPGKLYARVYYSKDHSISVPPPVEDPKDDTTGWSEIPINIVGSGIMPTFTPLRSYKGGWVGTGDSAVYKREETDITAIPVTMDVNDGSAKGFDGKDIYQFTAMLNYGTGLGKARNIAIEFAPNKNGAAEIFVDNSTTAYVPGTKLELPADITAQATRTLRVRATHEGLVQLMIYYYNDSGAKFNNSPELHNITIQDSSAGKDATFSSIVITGSPMEDGDEGIDAEQAAVYKDRFNKIYQDGKIPFDFSPDNETYDTINVPYAVNKLTLTAEYNDPRLNVDTKAPFTVKNANTNKFIGKDKTNPDNTDLVSRDTTVKIDIPPDKPLVLYINGTAQDGKNVTSYRLTVTRMPPSNVASLTSLELKTTRDEQTHTLTPAFNSEIYNYTLSLPYYYTGEHIAPNPPTAGDGAAIDNDVLFTAIAFGDWGGKPIYSGDSVVPPTSRLLSIFQNKNQAKVDLRYEASETDDAINRVNKVIISVTSEDKTKTAEYNVTINVEDPSDNSKLSDLKVSTQTRTLGIADIPFANNIVFDKNVTDYFLDIDYSCDNLRFEFMPENEFAQKVRILQPGETDWEHAGININYTKKGEDILRKVQIPNTDPLYQDEFIYQFDVLAENGKWSSDSDAAYVLHIARKAANDDARLADLKVTDAATGSPVTDFQFIKTKQDYSFSVPYTTESVSVEPISNEPALVKKVTVNDKEITTGRPSREIKLTAGAATKITIVVISEADTVMTYTLSITRTAPGTDARLISLAVNGGENMLPAPFVPSNSNYSVEIPEGAQQVTVTATPVDTKATLTVNGKATGNGSPSEAIITAGANSTIQVIVTAEDGKTTKLYTIRVTDYNYVKKSSDSELASLALHYADLSPRFKSGITSYEVFLKDEADYVDFMPTARSSKAKVTVSNGSKELTEYHGVYSTSVFTKPDPVTISVTSQDGTSTTEYNFTIYKQDKKKKGDFKPITSAMVNYEAADPIVIDISNYAIIDASVFNKLKTDYPNKSILFTGNDYSLKIKGSDITELVPNTTQYDLFFSFTSPDEEIIGDLLFDSDNPRDWDIEPVYIYFNDHGDLPAKMLLTLSLGGKYKNSQLFWNYYNDDRDRIDYYGYLISNAKGTITVPITHFSSYMVTTQRITAAEDKTNMNFGSMDGITGSSGSGSGSINSGGKEDPPRTGVSPEQATE